MDISDRIKELIRKNQLNAAKFADLIGVQRSNLSHVLTGRNKPGLDFIEKVLNQFPDVDANWLISGIAQRRDDNKEMNEEVNSNLKQELRMDLKKSPEAKVEDKFNNVTNKQAKVTKIIVYYSDKTFEEFNK